MGEVELGLFTAALGLSAPWQVRRTAFDGAQLDLYLDFPRGALTSRSGRVEKRGIHWIWVFADCLRATLSASPRRVQRPGRRWQGR
jgi:hypothetical protein